MLEDLILDHQAFVDTLPLALQVLSLLVVGLVPFLEGDVAAAIGVVTGVPLILALIFSAAGTILATMAAVAWGARIGEKRQRGERERRIMARVEKWGIPIAMLLGGFFVSVSVNAFVMSAAGLNRTIVLVSGFITAALNTAFVGLAAAGVLRLVL